MWGTAKYWAPNTRVRVVNGVIKKLGLIRNEMGWLGWQVTQGLTGGTEASNWVKNRIQGQVIIGVMDSTE